MVEKWLFSRGLPNRFFLTAGMMGFRGERIDLKLHPAHVRPPGELLLDRVTRAERQGDELPDEPCADGEAIEPRLAGTTT